MFDSQVLTRRALQRFLTRVEDSTKELIGTTDAPATMTPLMESLSDLGTEISSIRRQDLEKGWTRDISVTLFSDLLQHTSGFSQYEEQVRFQDFAGRPYALRGVSSLDRVRVHVFYLIRPTALERGLQGESHKSFWVDYFSATGALFRLTPT